MVQEAQEALVTPTKLLVALERRIMVTRVCLPLSSISSPLLHTFDDLRNLRCTINIMLTIYSALDFIEKKSGHTLSRDQNEKITDGARGLYEKQTGYVFFFFASPMLAPLSFTTNC